MSFLPLVTANRPQRQATPLRAVAARVVFVAMLVLGVAGLGARGVSAQAGDAQVRVVHASPDTPPVDVFVNGTRAIEGLAYGTATGFVALPAGSYAIAVAAAGAPIADAVINATLDLEAGVSYDVAAIGLLADISAQVSVVDRSTLPSGQTRVRVVHAAPDAPAVDIAVTGGDVLFGDLTFPSVSDYGTVPAGSYDLEVRLAGTGTVVLPLPGVALAAGTAYDIFAIGLVGDKSFTVLPLSASTATVMTMPNTGSGSVAAAAANASSAPVLWIMAALVALGALGVACRRSFGSPR